MQNIYELFQRYDSNPLNSKELVHQAWLDMMKPNAPTYELEKSNFGDKQKNTMFSKINPNEEVLLVQVNHGCKQLCKPLKNVE
jgi:hypothetical protein